MLLCERMKERQFRAGAEARGRRIDRGDERGERKGEAGVCHCPQPPQPAKCARAVRFR